MKHMFTFGLSVCLTAAGAVAFGNPYGAPTKLPTTGTPYANYYAAAHSQEDVAPGPQLDAAPVPDDLGQDYYGVSGDYNAQGACGCDDGAYCGEFDCWFNGKYCGGACGCNPWFARAGALYMTRDNSDRFFFNAEADDLPNQVLDNRDAEYGWVGGWEVSLGRCLSECTAIEVTFWQLGRMNGFATSSMGGNGLVSTMDFGDVEFGAIGAAAWFDNAPLQSLSRYTDIYNLELNLWHQPFITRGGFSFDFLMGVRYFNYENGFTYGSTQNAAGFGLTPADDAYLGVDVENHLVGFQIGAEAEWAVTRRWSLFARPKAGIYANYMNKDTFLVTGDGTSAIANGTGEAFPVGGNKTDVAFMTEIELGVQWQISRAWSAYAGYRAVAITGVSHADQGLPFYVTDTHDFRDVDSNGSMIVHGATLGLQYNW